MRALSARRQARIVNQRGDRLAEAVCGDVGKFELVTDPSPVRRRAANTSMANRGNAMVRRPAAGLVSSSRTRPLPDEPSHEALAESLAAGAISGGNERVRVRSPPGSPAVAGTSTTSSSPAAA